MEFYQEEESNVVRRCAHWAADLAVVICLAWFMIVSFGERAVVSGQSMAPLLASGDTVLLDRLIYDLKDPDRYDVICFGKEDGRSNIKRVIGLPGEVVQISSGRLLINGEALDPDSGYTQADLAGIAEHPIRLGPEEYFVLGDNRENSEDSRFSNIGNIRRSQILGKVWFRFLPLGSAGRIH